jgi:hypothetical protein
MLQKVHVLIRLTNASQGEHEMHSAERKQANANEK